MNQCQKPKMLPQSLNDFQLVNWFHRLLLSKLHLKRKAELSVFEGRGKKTSRGLWVLKFESTAYFGRNLTEKNISRAVRKCSDSKQPGVELPSDCRGLVSALPNFIWEAMPSIAGQGDWTQPAFASVPACWLMCWVLQRCLGVAAASDAIFNLAEK